MSDWWGVAGPTAVWILTLYGLYGLYLLWDRRRRRTRRQPMTEIQKSINYGEIRFPRQRR